MKEIVVHSFASGLHGVNPQAGVIRDPAGNLYGTTEAGGAFNWGVVYRITPSGRQTVLYSFTGGADGCQPFAGLVGDPSGNFYGTTVSGGAYNGGVIFKLDSSGHETVLYNFSPWSGGGSQPRSNLIRDAAGNLYGTAASGGASGAGVVFKLGADGSETTLYNFTGGADGSTPVGTLARDAAGNFYGATDNGGASKAGVVFKIDAAGHESTLYTFTGGLDGGYPAGGVILDPQGNLYGTTTWGGSTYYGVVFELDPTGHEKVLYSFTGGIDGAEPWAGVVRDPAGNLYGTTSSGGASGFGVVYQLTLGGQEEVLHSFAGGADGSMPAAGVILDRAGDLYGTTSQGGVSDGGVVYKIDAGGNETVLYGFPQGPDGAGPQARVVKSNGYLYGTTVGGGNYGYGTAYKLDPRGRETVLHAFTGGADGSWPEGGLVLDKAGNVYGTASSGGGFGHGVVYKIDINGLFTVLHSFDWFDGATPYGDLILDSSGNLYGTTMLGGGWGTVYKLDPNGTETVLCTFSGTQDGMGPTSGLVRDSSGNLYGVTPFGGAFGYGTVYKVDPMGYESVLLSFKDASTGYSPSGTLALDSQGNLYGTTAGSVFKLSPAGQETVLYTFTGGTDGDGPRGGVILDPAGSLYGTTIEGGAFGNGTVFKLDPSGNETVLYSFNGPDGISPNTGVIRDSLGNFYGTTETGGKNNTGVVFQLKAGAP